MTAQPWRFGANFNCKPGPQREIDSAFAGLWIGKGTGILDAGLSGDLPRMEMAEYEPHVMRAGGGGQTFVLFVCLFVCMHSLSIRSKLYPPRDIRIPNILKSHEPTPFWCGGSLLDYPIHVRLVLLVL